MTGYTFFMHPTSPEYPKVKGAHLYIGRGPNGEYFPRFVIHYVASEWLFIEKAWGKADDEVVSFPVATRWKRDNGGGTIWEWSDEVVTQPKHIADIKKMANAKKVVMRLEGDKYYKDITLTRQQIQALKEVVQAYEGARGRPW